MNYLILLIFLLSNPCHAQSNVVGLDRFVIGVTTPDSLKSIDFKEQEQACVKGTLTLPCTHIRSFKSKTLNAAGTLITDLYLIFYDNKLVKLSCAYDPELQEVFLAKHGRGMPKPILYAQFCSHKRNNPMALRSEVWQNADVLALTVHSKGYDSNCQMIETDKLTIFSQSILALTSDCDLQSVDPFAEEFEAVFYNHQERHEEKRENNKN